jgi:hypothetical protein
MNPQKIIRPDPISFTVYQIMLFYKETDAVLANGTAFLYEYKSKPYLITNWHNVSGRDPFSKEYLKSNAAIPDSIITWFRNKSDLSILDKVTIDLYKDDQMQEKNWIEHPVFKDNIDVVAIPLPEEISAKYSIHPINKLQFDNQFEAEVTDEVFILGFPFSSQLPLALPIWKKGSIASEPKLNQKGLPLLYVDTATRPGLSGSPVIYQRNGIHGLDDNGMPKDDTLFGLIRGFLGIYSGRLGKDDSMAQLGLIWKKNTIEELFKNIN